MGVFGGRLALAPIDKIPLHNVLDIATGTTLESSTVRAYWLRFM
jgi:hypothetical protein